MSVLVVDPNPAVGIEDGALTKTAGRVFQGAALPKPENTRPASGSDCSEQVQREANRAEDLWGRREVRSEPKSTGSCRFVQR
jgi:hypothetical protein